MGTSAQAAASTELLKENKVSFGCHEAVNKHHCAGKMEHPNVAIYAVHSLSVILGRPFALFSI